MSLGRIKGDLIRMLIIAPYRIGTLANYPSILHMQCSVAHSSQFFIVSYDEKSLIELISQINK